MFGSDFRRNIYVDSPDPVTSKINIISSFTQDGYSAPPAKCGRGDSWYWNPFVVGDFSII